MARIIDGVPYLTAGEAAARMKTTPLRVLMLMREKTLAGLNQEGEWLVTAESVEACGNRMPARSCRSSCASASGCGCGTTDTEGGR